MAQNDQHSFGEFIRSERLRRQITLREFARRLKMSAGNLSSIENARVVPTTDVLQRMANELGIDENELCGRAGKLTEHAQRTFSRIARTDPKLFRSMIERIGGAK